MSKRHDKNEAEEIQVETLKQKRLRERDRAYLIAVTKETMNLLGLSGGGGRDRREATRSAFRGRVRAWPDESAMPGRSGSVRRRSGCAGVAAT